MMYMDCIFEKKTMLRERSDGRFTVAWDMDNTLVDDFGARTRPGLVKCLKRMREKNIKLVVWTNSERSRAQDILKTTALERYFYGLIARESYELPAIRKKSSRFYEKIAEAFPREVDFQSKFESGKNLGLLWYDVLVDDNPWVASQAKYWGGTYRVEVCERFTGRGSLSFPGEIERITDKVIAMARPTIWQRIGLAK